MTDSRCSPCFDLSQDRTLNSPLACCQPTQSPGRNSLYLLTKMTQSTFWLGVTLCSMFVILVNGPSCGRFLTRLKPPSPASSLSGRTCANRVAISHKKWFSVEQNPAQNPFFEPPVTDVWFAPRIKLLSQQVPQSTFRILSCRCSSKGVQGRFF